MPAKDCRHVLEVLPCSLLGCSAVIMDCLTVLYDRKQNPPPADTFYTHQMLREETAALKLMGRIQSQLVLFEKKMSQVQVEQVGY